MSGIGSSPSLVATPRLGAWIRLHDGRVEVRSGKVELGQGIRTALAQIVADGLGVDLDVVDMVAPTTAGSPDESYTAGSLSVQHSGGALRQVCAEARAVLVGEAARRLGTDAAVLGVRGGSITAPDGRSTTYWALDPDRLLDRDVTGDVEVPDAGPGGVVGTSVPRPDLEAKLLGRPGYLHDLRPDGLLHARVVRPPGPGWSLLDVDDGVATLAGVVAVVRDRDFLGVVATREESATVAAEQLRRRCRWSEGPMVAWSGRTLADDLRRGPSTEEVLHHVDVGAGGAPVDGLSLHRRFSRPYLAHASIGPSAALARWSADGRHLEVWSHSQGIHNLRRALAATLDVDCDAVVVTHADGAGCYGHNGADDAALDAALLARAVPGHPVRLVWSRRDELSWSPLGPAMVVEVTVAADHAGHPQVWEQHVWSSGHSARPWSPGHPPMLAATEVERGEHRRPSGDPPMHNGGGAGRNAVPGYDIASVRVVAHRPQAMPLRTSAMRALGAHLNVFAIESVIDELAAAAGVDAVAHRMSLLSDPRARAVLDAAARRAGWGRAVAAGSGLGVGVARYKGSGAYCAVVAEVEAERRVRVRHLWVAADVGTAVNPDGVASQLEGAAVQATSWTVLERVRFDSAGVTSEGWDDYPIITFSDVPDIDVTLVGMTTGPPLGAGEAAVGPTAAAIGNALHAALGVRVRDLPLSPANVLAAIG